MTMTIISPFSGVPEQQDLTPSEGIRSFATAATSDGLEKLGRYFSGKTKALLKSPRRGGARGPTWVVPRGQVHGPRGPPCFGPRGSPLFGLLPTAFLPMKNQLGIFPFII